jgi:ubiquinone biosynthesis monooxygenase Coq7
MSIAARPGQIRRLASCQLPLYDFLAPRFAHQSISIRSHRMGSTSFMSTSASRHNSSTEFPAPEQSMRSPKSGEQAAAKPSPLNKPLTKAQRDFLTSAVSSLNFFSTLYILVTDKIPPTATSKPSWRTSRNLNLHLSNAPYCCLAPESSASDEAHV